MDTNFYPIWFSLEWFDKTVRNGHTLWALTPSFFTFKFWLNLHLVCEMCYDQEKSNDWDILRSLFYTVVVSLIPIIKVLFYNRPQFTWDNINPENSRRKRCKRRWKDGSRHKCACCQVWWPVFDLLESCSGRRDLTSQCFPVTQTQIRWHFSHK